MVSMSMLLETTQMVRSVTHVADCKVQVNPIRTEDFTSNHFVFSQAASVQVRTSTLMIKLTVDQLIVSGELMSVLYGYRSQYKLYLPTKLSDLGKSLQIK